MQFSNYFWHVTHNIPQFYRTRKERTLTSSQGNYKQQKLKFRTPNMDPMRLYSAQLCVAERAWGVLRIVQALGENVTNNCVLWSPRATRCGLEPQPAAAALASAFMMHPIIPSPSLRCSPGLRDPAQLYQPRAIYHLGWGKWLDTGSWMHARWVLAETLLWLFLRAVRRAAVWPHPSSAFAETGCGSWWDSPNIGPATLVPPAENKVRWNPLMTTPRHMQSVLGPVCKPRPVYQTDNPLHNMVCGVSQDSILETAPHQVFTGFAKFFYLRCKLSGLSHLLLQIKIQGDLQANDLTSLLWKYSLVEIWHWIFHWDNK